MKWSIKLLLLCASLQGCYYGQGVEVKPYTQKQLTQEMNYQRSTEAIDGERIRSIRSGVEGRKYLTMDDIQGILSIIKHYEYIDSSSRGGINWRNSIPLNESFDLLRMAIEQDLLPFRANFYLALEKENFDEAEIVRRNWVNALEILKKAFDVRNPSLAQNIQFRCEKLEIVGLTDPLLIRLRKELIIALSEKKWDDAEKIQNIIAGRAKELAAPQKPVMAERAGSGASQTTLVIEQPPYSQVEQIPRYGLSDYARVLSVLGGRSISSKDAATLKLFDLLMQR